MTVREILAQASNLLSGRIESAVLLAWFNDIELMVQMQLLGLTRTDAVQYTEQNLDAQPIVQGHYQRVYSYWLLARGHARLQNSAGYERYRKLYISEYGEYRKWFARTHGIAEERAEGKGMLLSAYSLALKHGFSGSEAEWLASLRGADGQNGTPGAQGARGEKGEKGDKGDKGERGEQGERGLQGEPGHDGKDGATMHYDLQYDPETHVLQLLCNGEVLRSFDLTQQTDVQTLMGILDANGAGLLDRNGAIILPAAA